MTEGLLNKWKVAMPRNEFTAAADDVLDEFRASLKNMGKSKTPPYRQETGRRKKTDPVSRKLEELGINPKELRDG